MDAVPFAPSIHSGSIQSRTSLYGFPFALPSIRIEARALFVLRSLPQRERRPALACTWCRGRRPHRRRYSIRTYCVTRGVRGDVSAMCQKGSEDGGRRVRGDESGCDASTDDEVGGEAS